jgi:hypothetical protein
LIGKTVEKPQRTFVWIAGLWAEIWTLDLQNMMHKGYPLINNIQRYQFMCHNWECRKWVWPVSWYYTGTCIEELKTTWDNKTLQLRLSSNHPEYNLDILWKPAQCVIDEESGLSHSVLGNSPVHLFPCHVNVCGFTSPLSWNSKQLFHFILLKTFHNQKDENINGSELSLWKF